MEDESDERMIEEYSPSSKETNTTKLRWIFNNGFGLGKKVVITGVVISSAPVVLPPLVIISALGFAFSVPFGLVFASYACTEKLMSKLLPSPTMSPLTFEFQTDSSEEEEEEDSSGFEGEFVIEEEEKEQTDDFKRGVEMRIELDDYENKSLEVKEDRKKEEGYEEDVGKYLVDEEKPEGIFPSEEGEEQKSVLEVRKNEEPVTRVVVVVEGSGEVKGDKEEEEIVRESTGLLEKITEGGEIERKKGIKEVSEEWFDDKNASLENLEDRDVEVEKVNREVKGTESEFEDKSVKLGEFGGEERRDKLKEEVRETGDSTSEQNKLNGKVKKRRGKKRGKSSLDEGKLNDGKKIDEMTLDEEKANTENIVLKPNEDTRVVNGESIEGSGEDYKYNVEGLSAEEKQIVIDQISNAREAAEERGSDVGDDRRAEGVPYSERLGENDDVGDSTAEEIADSLELPISKGVEPKYTAIAPEPESPMPSNEVSLSEDKVWQQIDALRAIVGYKAAHDPSLIGELKALYIFTGVEPPPSFKDPRDLIEVNEKLRFLMSVVGVK